MQRMTYLFLTGTLISLIQPAQGMQNCIAATSGKNYKQAAITVMAETNLRCCGMDKKKATRFALMCCYSVPTLLAASYCPWSAVAEATSEMYSRDPALCFLGGSTAGAVCPLTCLLPYGCTKMCVKDLFFHSHNEHIQQEKQKH